MRRIRSLPLLAVAAATLACADITGVESDGVRATARADGVVVQNRRAETIYYFAIDRMTAALTLWGACEDPLTCRAIAARSERLVPASEIMGWPESGEVILYWWELEPKAGGGFRPDEIRSLVVPLGR